MSTRQPEQSASQCCLQPHHGALKAASVRSCCVKAQTLYFILYVPVLQCSQRSLGLLTSGSISYDGYRQQLAFFVAGPGYQYRLSVLSEIQLVLQWYECESGWDILRWNWFIGDKSQVARWLADVVNWQLIILINLVASAYSLIAE